MSLNKSLNIDTSKPVLVTGATGYVAGVLVKELLSRGLTVHAAVRDPTKKDRLQYLVDLAEKSPGSIKFFKGNLLEPGSYAEGMKGCSVVFHTASPFAMSVEDPQRDLVTPAVEGTKNVLKSASQTPSVKRVVVTSSVVAIIADAAETNEAPNGVLNEDVWNFAGSLTYQPYTYSKTMAEIAAWQMAGSQTQYTLVTMNPGLVMGPGVKCHPSSESFTIVKELTTTYANGCADANMGIVDVRDVARAHVAGAFLPEAQGRHVLVGKNSSYKEMADYLREKYSPQYKIAPRKLPKWLIWLFAPLVGVERRYISRNVEVPTNFDNFKAKQELGMEFTPLKKTMHDMFQQMIEAKVV